MMKNMENERKNNRNNILNKNKYKENKEIEDR